MTMGGEHEREPEGDDFVAAEYVLGVLSAEERQAVARRIDAEPALARLVDDWEARLSPMADGYRPAEVPASVKAALDRRLFSSATQGIARAPVAAVSRARTPFLESLAFWRVMTAAAVAALAVAIVVPALRPAPAPAERLIASLAADGSDVRYVALLDRATGHVGLSHLAGERAADRDFELWMIEGDKAPVSLGVIPTGERTEIPLTEEERQKVARGAVLAITIEPRGGSPTGAPTGPVVAAGDLHSI